MRVRELSLPAGFLGPVARELRLPDRGVVVVRGANGAGKSSLVEGAAWGCWGETLRGDSPWVLGTKAGEVEVTTDALVALRSYGRSTKLAWRLFDQAAPESFLTTTKAQEALEAHIGAFDVWQRTHVLSAATLGAFTRATDAERKRLLEALLGLGQLDEAAERARKGLSDAEKSTAVREAEAKSAHNAVVRLAGELGSTARDVALQRPRPQGDVRRQRAGVAGLLQGRVEARAALDTHVAEVRRLCAHTDTLRERRRAVEGELQERECARCGAELPAHKLNTLQTECANLSAQIDQHEARRVEMEDERDLLAGIADSAAKRHADAAEELAELEQAWRDYELSQRLTGESQAKLSLQLAQAEEDADDAALALARARREEAIARAAAKVLSTQGVRAHLLTGVMQGVEALANAWLPRLSNQFVQVTLRLKEQGRADVSLSVQGDGWAPSYRGCSTGQQRRLDVAFLFALAEVAQGVSGVGDGGTLWVDEAFDGLDLTGRAAVAEAVDEIARERCVVVITHDEALGSMFKNVAKRVRVERGEVTVV